MKNNFLRQLLMYTRYTLYVFFFQVVSMSLLLASSGKAQEPLNVKEVRLTIQFQNEQAMKVFTTP